MWNTCWCPHRASRLKGHSKVIPQIPKLNLLRVNSSSVNLLINLTTPGDCNIKIISWPSYQHEVPRRCHLIFQCPLPQPAKTYCYINWDENFSMWDFGGACVHFIHFAHKDEWWLVASTRFPWPGLFHCTTQQLVSGLGVSILEKDRHMGPFHRNVWKALNTEKEPSPFLLSLLC